jgi:DNA-binding LytR/AlgR family response regulator
VSDAMTKLSDMKTIFSGSQNMAKVEEDYKKQSIKERFLVRMGSHIHSLKTENIALFFAEGRTVFIITDENKKYIIDYKLEELSDILDAKQFFRANRTYILNLNSIKDVLVYSNSRLKVQPYVNVEKDIIISRDKVSSFKKWFEGLV